MAVKCQMSTKNYNKIIINFIKNYNIDRQFLLMIGIYNYYLNNKSELLFNYKCQNQIQINRLEDFN